LEKPEFYSNKLLNAFTDEWKTKKREYIKNEGWKILKDENGSNFITKGDLNKDNLEDVAIIIEKNDKKRFTISEDGKRIRAAQGHSTKQVDIQYCATTPPDILYHGTAEKSVQSIFGQGLHAGSRHFVHLSADIETAIKVGSRHGKPVVLTINTAAMLADGHQFYLADNGVWLTEKVPSKFIAKL